MTDTARDWSPVAAWLSEQAGEPVTIEAAKQLSGGAIQENWLLTMGQGGASRQVVLRCDAPSAVAVSLSRAQEFALLKAAEAADVAVPCPLYLCEDEAVMGRSFYVMEFCEGLGLGPKVVKETRLGGDREALAEELGRQMARIHTITPPRDDLAFLTGGEGNAALEAVATYRNHLDALDAPHPALEWALRWAELYAPETREVTLVHQDFRTGNFLVDERGLSAILDWEFCAWGDPMSDIGWFCCKYWRFSRPDLEAGGIGSRVAFYRGYQSESGREIDDEAVAYWEVVAFIRWAIIAIQQGERHFGGEENSLELALTGLIAPELELECLRLTAPGAWGAAS